MTQRGLFLDRDGVINVESGWLYRVEDVRFVDGIFSLCQTAERLGYRLMIVTNQSGIGRGLYTAEDFETLMAWMRERFAAEQVTLDAVYHCPYHPEHGLGEFRREHEDRKPAPGMLLRGAREFGLELGACVLIGDRCTDIAAANAAGLGTAFLLGSLEGACAGDFRRVETLAEVEAWLLEQG